MDRVKQTSELDQILRKVLMDLSQDSIFSSLDRERALNARLEDWLEEQKQLGKKLIQDMLQPGNIEIEGKKKEDAAFVNRNASPTLLSSDKPNNLLNDKQFKPIPNDDDLFHFEESSSLPVPEKVFSNHQRQESDQIQNDDFDLYEENQEVDGVLDSYQPAIYGSLPINISSKQGQAAKKVSAEMQQGLGPLHEKKFEPPHEYAARTFQETSDGFDRPFSLSTRKQSLI